jgi:Family of unknown function (DUF6580)
MAIRRRNARDDRAVLSCALLFFAATNLAVWAFSGMYSHDWARLAAFYVAALPFLKQSVAAFSEPQATNEQQLASCSFGASVSRQVGARLCGHHKQPRRRPLRFSIGVL